MKLSKPIAELLYQRRKTEIEQFDERTSPALEVAIADIGRVYTNLVVMLAFGQTTMRRYEAFALLNEALGSLVSAFRLCREGSNRDALALVRIAVETGAVGAHVALDQEGYDLYMRNAKPAYDTKLGIRFATQHVDHRIARFISNLASSATHPSRKGFGPDRDERGTVINLGLQRTRTNEQIDRALFFISTGACFVLRSIEVSFIIREETLGFHQISNTHSMTVIATKLLDRRFAKFPE